MAADAITAYKSAFGSGEAKFQIRVGADNNVNTEKSEQPEVFKAVFHKDIIDQLHANTITALRAITLGNLIDQAFGSDSSIP